MQKWNFDKNSFVVFSQGKKKEKRSPPTHRPFGVGATSVC